MSNETLKSLNDGRHFIISETITSDTMFKLFLDVSTSQVRKAWVFLNKHRCENGEKYNIEESNARRLFQNYRTSESYKAKGTNYIDSLLEHH